MKFYGVLLPDGLWRSRAGGRTGEPQLWTDHEEALSVATISSGVLITFTFDNRPGSLSERVANDWADSLRARMH